MKQHALALVGIAGSGKSTVARLLAPLTGLLALDTDELVEQQSQKSIPHIFAEDGEQTFRRLECLATKKCLAAPCVLSTGGGAVTYADTVSALKEHAFVVWLRAGLDTVLQRVQGDGHRPLAARTAELFAERQPLYATCADAVVDVDAKSPQEIADEVLALWKARGAQNEKQ